MTMFRKINRYCAPEAGDEGGESSGGAVGTGNDARIALLNGIGDALDEGDRGEELANVNDDDTTEPFREVKAASEETPPPEPVVEVVEDAAPAKVKIKVNGEELELTQEELIARAQKVESADRYLAEAAAARKETRPEPPKTEDIDYKALVHAIQVGTEEEAEAALRKLHTPQQRPSAMDDVSRVVDERLTFRDAMMAFKSEYADIVSDPKLNRVAQQMDEEMLANGDTRAYADRYTEIGENLRGWVTKLGGGKKEEPKVDTSRLERKEALPKEPTAAAGKSAPPKTEPDEDDDPSSVIRKMAQARGGPQWMRA
jgi:hypothetical protein